MLNSKLESMSVSVSCSCGKSAAAILDFALFIVREDVLKRKRKEGKMGRDEGMLKTKDEI